MTHPTYDRLTRANAVLLLVDHQVGLVAGSRYPEPQDLRKNVVGLARASKILGVPIVATTTMSNGMFGPTFPELAELLKDQEIIDRTTNNPFDEPRIPSAIKKTGRSKVIVAGVNTAVCTCFPAISAVNAGYGTYAAIDASGAFDAIELQTAMIRMTQAGVIVADYNAIVVEMLANNADPLAAQVYAAIGLSHFVSMRDIYSTIKTPKIVTPS
ncbi:MAG TPA: isochorismatase family protein [Candidatus Nitrosopolaris sp.]|nr:isochorismatase family protein [Candidatus Nitrosopolaris sp.]